MNYYYSKNECNLINDDCINAMNNMVKENIKIDKIITSPPYNIVRPNASDRGYDLYQDRLMTNEQYIDWVINIFNLYDKLLNENGCIMWNQSYGTENTEVMNLCIAEILKRTNFTLADIIIWKKDTATPNNVSSNKLTRICEFVYVFCRRSEFYTFTSNKKVVSHFETGQKVYENIYNFISAKNNDSTQNLNKATFSSEFVYELMNRYVLPTDVVMDNFSGTGTTMKCCYARGNNGYFIELSEEQCQYTVKRIDTGCQLSMFDL